MIKGTPLFSLYFQKPEIMILFKIEEKNLEMWKTYLLNKYFCIFWYIMEIYWGLFTPKKK